MPQLTGAMLPQSSAFTNQQYLQNIGRNILATSGVLTASSSNLLTGYMSNLTATSGVLNAASALLIFNAVNNLVVYGTSAVSFATQMLGASSCIDTMSLQAKAGFQVSS